MAKFIINISGLGGKNKLVRFDVPPSRLMNCKDYESLVNEAGWWYMNRIDSISCTGDYRWSVFPESLLTDLKKEIDEPYDFSVNLPQ